MREEMIFQGDKPVTLKQWFGGDRLSEILAGAHAAAKSMYGANYKAAVEPICEELRTLMAETGCDAIKVGIVLVVEMESVGEMSTFKKALTLAAIYEVDRQSCPWKRN